MDCLPIASGDFYMAEAGSSELLACDLFLAAAVCNRASDEQFRIRARHGNKTSQPWANVAQRRINIFCLSFRVYLFYDSCWVIVSTSLSVIRDREHAYSRQSFSWNLGGRGHDLEFLLLNLWVDLLCFPPFHPTPRVLAKSPSQLTVEGMVCIRTLKCAVWLLAVINGSYNWYNSFQCI